MRFKPQPRFRAGALVPPTGAAAAGDPVGRMFPQPLVRIRDGREVPLDEALGPWFSVLVYGTDPRRVFAGEALDTLRRLGARLVCVRPATQLHWEPRPDGGPTDSAPATADDPVTVDPVTVVGDHTGRLKAWFDTHPVGFAVIRPDRYVAAAALNQHARQVTADLAAALGLPRTATVTPGATDVPRPLLPVAQPVAGVVGARA
jgi:3-(3-hydroxy-phenyl)propionate hydroxylase